MKTIPGTASSQKSGEAYRRILVVSPRWLGDAVLSQSLLIQLQIRYPDSKIDVLTTSALGPVYDLMPQVDETLIFNSESGKVNAARRLAIAKMVKAQQYDWAIVIPNSFKSALIPWLAKIPIRTGTVHEARKKLINDPRILDIFRFPKAIDRMALLGINLGEEVDPGFAQPPRIEIAKETANEVLEKFELNPAAGPIVVFAPGSEGGIAKRWPAEHYAEAAKTLAQEGCQIALLSSAKDLPVCDQIQGLSGEICLNLGGKTSLTEAFGILSRCSAMVSNDSGLMHVAGALGKPVVAIFGPTFSGHTPVLSSNSRMLSLDLPCAPCYEKVCPLEHHRCMRDILPKKVSAEVLEVISSPD